MLVLSQRPVQLPITFLADLTPVFSLIENPEAETSPSHGFRVLNQSIKTSSPLVTAISIVMIFCWKLTGGMLSA